MSQAAVLTTCHTPCRLGCPWLFLGGAYARGPDDWAATSDDANTARTNTPAHRVTRPTTVMRRLGAAFSCCDTDASASGTPCGQRRRSSPNWSAIRRTLQASLHYINQPGRATPFSSPSCVACEPAWLSLA